MGEANYRKMKSSYSRRQRNTAYIFVAPALILLLLFLIIPAFMAFGFSFTDFYVLAPDRMEMVGVDNYASLLSDELFFKCLRNTFYFTVVIVPVEAVIAMGLAILVNRKIVGRTFFRTAYFAPVISSLTVVSILWVCLYNPNDGLFNAILNMVGLPGQRFLRSADQAMNSILVMSIWQGVGYQMIIFIAGLNGISQELYEAAAIDGANSVKKFFYITLPGLRNVISFIVVYVTIQAFKVFTQPYIMTFGGPQNSTRTLVYYIYQQGFQYKKAGYASAMAVVFFLIVVLVSMALKRLLIERD